MKLFIKTAILLMAVHFAFSQEAVQDSVQIVRQDSTILPQRTAVIPEITGSIKGVLSDTITDEGAAFASVSLTDPMTNKAVNGALCDETGAFEIHKIKPGTYNIVIALIGFHTRTITNISISDSTLDLGRIPIKQIVKELQTVTIQGQKELFEDKADRLVYNAENDATNKGGDATDVLRKVPMLSVDLDGNVSMRGSQNIRVLINNKPSTMSANSIADALRQIPADQIKSVEVITSPSAKYDAEGSGGVININTKKNILEGIWLNIDGSAGLRGSNLGLNGSYRKGKMGFSVGGHGRASYNIPGNYFNSQQTLNNDGSTTLTNQSADTRNIFSMGNYNIGWDYDINKKNSLAANVKYSFRNGHIYQDNLLTQTYLQDSLLSTSHRNVDASNTSNTVDASLTYNHTFDKPQREFNLMGLYSRNNANNNFTNNILNNADLSTIDSRLKNLNKSYNQEVTVQADYQTPVGKTQLVELGVKNITRTVSSNYQYFSATGNAPFTEVSNNTLSNAFNYNQNVSAAYMTYALTLPKSYSVKAGARYEYTTINAHYQNTNESINIPSYGVLVPSINISKKLNNGSTLKASFNRRIQRPSLQFLNPNVQAANPLNITIGNPNLQPEFTNNYELSYSSFLKKFSYTISGFVKNTTGAIQSVRTVQGADTIRTTYQNIGSENTYGFNIFASVNITNKFTLSGGTDIYYAILKNNVSDPLYNASNEGWVAGYRAFATYSLAKSLSLQFFGFYRGRQVQLQGYQGGFGIYSLSIKKDFMNKKASLGFGAENFFNFNGFKVHNSLESAAINQSGTNTLYNMNFKVTFSYRIGKAMDSKPKKRKSVDNDDMKEGGDNNNIQQQNSPSGSGQTGTGTQNSGQRGPGSNEGSKGKK